jgi:hypothetical protein
MNTFFYYLNIIAFTIGLGLITSLRKEYIHWVTYLVACCFLYYFVALRYTFDRLSYSVTNKYEPSVLDTFVYDVIPVCITVIPYIVVAVTKSDGSIGNNGKNSFFRNPFSRNKAPQT